MAKDSTYTNGVIAVKEKYLLKDKLFKLCETDAEEALRALSESGFGKGAEVADVYGYERLVAADEAEIDGFIREYAPSHREKAYLLAPRDFHNAKACVKARYAGQDIQKLSAPDGLIPVRVISECVNSGNCAPLGKILGGAVLKAASLFSREGEPPSGAEIGAIFEKAQFSYLVSECGKNALLKKLVSARADMTNILTALRSQKPEYAKKNYVCGGELSVKQLEKLFGDDKEKAAQTFSGTPYYGFVKKCFADRAEGRALTDAEKIAESYETEYLSAGKYEPGKTRTFMYYVFRRRAENANVRILFVCLLAGMNEAEIKKRLRSA